MCLIAFDHRPGAPMPLRLIANRDERHDRATAELGHWDDAPDIVGGRDLVAGGSWLAAHRRGRFAAVTNVRDPAIAITRDSPSRGWLVRDALQCDDLPLWLERLAGGEARRYGGFNLLVGDGTRLWYLHRGHDSLALHALPGGTYGLSNARLNSPWPKLELARAALARSTDEDWIQGALEAMHDSREVEDPERLPDTGVGLALERFLSPPFIRGERYGTRATTWLEWHRGRHIDIAEQRFGPNGRKLGETSLRVELAPQASCADTA